MGPSIVCVVPSKMEGNLAKENFVSLRHIGGLSGFISREVHQDLVGEVTFQSQVGGWVWVFHREGLSNFPSQDYTWCLVTSSLSSH